MNINDIKKIEIEITSNCNAACPGCARTQKLESVNIQSFGLDDLKRMFPEKDYIERKQFKFCGVLGDPAFNPECVDMVDYLTSNGGYCQISTNGGIQTVDWWSRLGQISKQTGLVDTVFCVDGHRETNHIYRVNTVFDVIARNIQSYADSGGDGTWMFIVFDHNEHELPIAEEHAKKLGFKFATRTGMRNSLNKWNSIIKKKENGQLQKEQVVITTEGEKEHSKKEKVKELDQFITLYKSNLIDEEAKNRIVSSIKCKLIHEGEFFIASDQTLWPCCFLWDSNFHHKKATLEKFIEYGLDWNSLKHHTIDEILEHPWFAEILRASWDPTHSKHFARCIRTCAYDKAYQNEIKFK